MDVREKLVELLTGFYGCDPMYYNVDALAIADHLVSNGVTVQEWISVEDRLPEDDSDVIAYLRTGEEGRIFSANYGYTIVLHGISVWEFYMGDE